MASLFDVFGRLLLEDGGKKFVADSTKAGAKAGDAVAKTMGQRVKEGLGTAVRGALGAGAGAAVGAFAASAGQAGDAVALLGARTGKTREELAGYEDRLRAIHSANFGRDFNDIADVLSQVESGLHLSGEEADEFTKSAITLRDVFGKEVNETLRAARPLMENFQLSGVKALDLISAGLQAGGENGEDLLDTFQEYSVAFRDMGFSAEEFLDILVGGLKNGARNTDQIADAVKEFDIRIRDGSKLSHDALEQLGIDAADFTAKLGSGAINGAQAMELINDRLRKVGNTSEQEQLGVALYGTKWEDVGAKAILALDNSEGAVEALGVTVDGASKQMQDAIASGPTAGWQSFVRSVFGGLNEILQAVPGLEQALTPLAVIFGPALSTKIGAGLGAAAGILSKRLPNIFGPLGKLLAGAILPGNLFVGPLETALEGGVDGAMRGGRLKGITGKLGKFMGSGLGKFLGAAFAAVAIVEVVNTYNEIKAGLNEQGAQIGKDVANQIATGTVDQLQASKGALEQGIADLNKTIDFGLFTNDARANLQKQLDEVNAAIAAKAAQAGPKTGAALASGKGAVDKGADTMVDGIDDSVEAATVAAAKEAKKTPLEVAEGLRSDRSAVQAAIAQLHDDITNQLSRTREAAGLAGYFTSKDFREGMRSNDPVVKKQAEATRQLVVDRLVELVRQGGPLGKKAMAELEKGMRSRNPTVRAAATEAKKAVDKELNAIKGRAAGQKAGADTAKGLLQKLTPVGNAARALANRVFDVLLGTMSAQFRSEVDTRHEHRAGGGDVQAHRPYIVGEYRPELFIPDVPGTIVPQVPSTNEMQALPAGGGGTTVYELHATVQAVQPRATALDVARELGRAARYGRLRPKVVGRRELWEGSTG